MVTVSMARARGRYSEDQSAGKRRALRSFSSSRRRASQLAGGVHGCSLPKRLSAVPRHNVENFSDRKASNVPRLLFTLAPGLLFPEPGATKCRPFVLVHGCDGFAGDFDGDVGVADMVVVVA